MWLENLFNFPEHLLELLGCSSGFVACLVDLCCARKAASWLGAKHKHRNQKDHFPKCCQKLSEIPLRQMPSWSHSGDATPPIASGYKWYKCRIFRKTETNKDNKVTPEETRIDFCWFLGPRGLFITALASLDIWMLHGRNDGSTCCESSWNCMVVVTF